MSDLTLDSRMALTAVLRMCLSSGAQQAASGTVPRKEILVSWDPWLAQPHEAFECKVSTSL